MTYYMTTTIVAAILGLALVSIIRPGSSQSEVEADARELECSVLCQQNWSSWLFQYCRKACSSQLLSSELH